jgi:tRNA-Thr(GGU) m(6)t(6)A37 methyltransferase TsaA
MNLVVRPIGVIRTPFRKSEGVPIQASVSDVMGEAKLVNEYVAGLMGLDGFSHLILVYWFHKSKEPTMIVVPYMADTERGLFATRAPARPNPIGISVVELVEVKGRVIRFRGADMLDGTPLLDIKPFVPTFDNRPHAKSGWLADQLDSSRPRRSDSRFEAIGTDSKR